MAPSSLMATNQPTITEGNLPAASIMDMVPMTNLMPFGMCTSMSNPTVASATAAALGVLTPMPCVPVPAGPWTCPGKVMVANKPILTSDGKLTCAYGGSISITNPGQTTVKIN